MLRKIVLLVFCSRSALAIGEAYTARGAVQGPCAGRQSRCRLPVPRLGLLDDVQAAAGNLKSTFDGVKAAYADDDFVPVGYARARHILFLASGDANAKAEALARRIATGEISFADAALRFSACPTRDLHGSLGTFPSLSRLRRGTLRGDSTPYDGKDTSLIGSIVFSPETPVGKVCKVETQWGVHLVLVEARGEADAGLAGQMADETARLVVQAKRGGVNAPAEARQAGSNNGFGARARGAPRRGRPRGVGPAG
jgi:hypothetical protein